MSVGERAFRQPVVAIAGLASEQFGIIGRAQALQAGLSPSAIHRRVDSGLWIRLYEGVYALAGAPPGWRRDLMAAQLWAGENSVLSHRSAAALHRLPGIEGGFVEVTVHSARRSPSPALLVHRSTLLPATDCESLPPFRVTGIARTVVDLASVLDDESLETILDGCLTRRLVTVPRLKWQLRQIGRAGRKGTKALGRLLDERGAPAAPMESRLEVKFLRLIREAGLPLPVRQFEVRIGEGRRAKIDFAYPRHRLAIECDGYLFHSGRQAWASDRDRSNLLTSQGWRILRVTWADLAEPEPLVDMIRRLLG